MQNLYGWITGVILPLSELGTGGCVLSWVTMHGEGEVSALISNVVIQR
jgi:hypothetical protein